MTLFRWLALPVFTPLLLGGCGGFGEAMTAHTDVVARAAGKELRVEEAAQMLAANPEVPADPQVVRALADIWIDYTLLATAVVEDSTLGALDLDAFVVPAREQTLMVKLRDRVIRADTTFTDAELRQAWTTEGPGAEVRARHILLRVPAEATPQQRDSVRALAGSLRQRAVGGEDFATLAQEYSADGSATRGGDLGFFGRGRMVAPFEEAAFALEPGGISEVVESPFGYHVIKVEERRQPELDPNEMGEFRAFLVQRAQQEAETEYLDSISAAASVQVQSGGLAVVREIASRPDLSLRGRAADRVIATYEDGEFTSGEFLEFIRTQPAQVQTAFASATDDQLETVVQQLVRQELLLREAEENDITVTREEEEALRNEARTAIRSLVDQSGLLQLARAGANDAAVSTRVNQMLEGAITGQVQLAPIGRLGFVLRDLYSSEINEGTFGQVIEQIEAIRASQPAPPAPQGALPMPQGAQPAPPAPDAP